jgi:NADPH:quinone reductase-like Zn-dependent oxidoreductase
MQTWEIVSGDGVDALKLVERETPIPGPGQVRVRMNANSINYRDLITIEGAGARKLPFPTVPNSDGAGVITKVGEGVKLKEGDRVTSCHGFRVGWRASGRLGRGSHSARKRCYSHTKRPDR